MRPVAVAGGGLVGGHLGEGTQRQRDLGAEGGGEQRGTTSPARSVTACREPPALWMSLSN